MKEAFKAQNIAPHLVRVLCDAAAPGGEPIGTIQLLPRGPDVKTVDGRSFKLSRPEAVIAASPGVDGLLLDWEHGSESPFGSSRAAGWVRNLRLESSGVFGSVTYTPKGAEDVRTKAFRFISPVLLLDPDTREVQSIVSCALTNSPAIPAMTPAQVEAYSARLSARGTLQAVDPKVRERLRKAGLTDSQIGAAAQFVAANRASRAQQAPWQDELTADARARLKKSGLSDEQITRASQYAADRRAQQRAERGR
jgi:phage I-like protein